MTTFLAEIRILPNTVHRLGDGCRAPTVCQGLGNIAVTRVVTVLVLVELAFWWGTWTNK